MIDFVMFVAGAVLLIYFGGKTVTYAEELAIRMGLPVLFIGLFVVAIGTDLPEITNSVISSVLGHGDINVGDSIGSSLAQITLVPAIVVLFSKNIKVKLGDVIIPGFAVIIALGVALFVVYDGHIGMIDAMFLILIFFLIMLALYKYLDILRYENNKHAKNGIKQSPAMLSVYLLLSFIGVLISAYMLVNGVIGVSKLLNIPQYILSFFGVALSTSLPEIAVNSIAMNRKKYEIALGGIIGSCIIDATLSIGIGPLINPISVTPDIAITTILYTMFASAIVLGLIAYKKKLDRSIGIIALLLYMFAYIALLF